MKPIVVRFGALVSHVPYALLPGIGGVYNNYLRQIKAYEKAEDKQDWIFRKTYRIVEYAISHIPFYKEFYARKGFSLNQLRTFEDIIKIPIVTKKDLMAVPIGERSAKSGHCYVANTGGSTGVPLSFYKTKSLQIKETVFHNRGKSVLGYVQSDIRLYFIGRSKSNVLSYDLTRNRLLANIYIPFEQVLKEIASISKSARISYIQGYPSVLYEFALYVEAHPQQYAESGLEGRIKGVFFNSEYPYPEYRKKIEDVFRAKSVASYGHTEGCVVAFDNDGLSYQVEQSYGYAEAVQIDGERHLVGTCYDNFISPFIRYDTGDIIDDALAENGILRAFKMMDGGRSGQYIFDKNEKRISLTGLIFGRHHDLFNYCSQIQISQDKHGEATVYYVAGRDALDEKQAHALFDTSDIDMDFSFIRIEKPVRTQSGKALLLVNSQGIDN